MTENKNITFINDNIGESLDYMWIWNSMKDKRRPSMIDVSASFDATTMRKLINDKFPKSREVFTHTDIYKLDSKKTENQKEYIVELDEGAIYIHYSETDKNEVIEFQILYDCYAVTYEYIDENIISILKESKKKQKRRTPKGEYYLISMGNYGLDLQPAEIDMYPKNLELSYGEDFIPKNEVICDFLKSKKSGLVMLNGDSGTGKTTYIKYLIHKFHSKMKFLYLSPATFEALLSPDFTMFLYKHKNSVIILEDAETLILPRESGNEGSGIANLLNIASGLPGDSMNMKIILTYNTKDSDRIDTALLRSGRLIAEHEFGLVEIERAKRIAESIGIESDEITSSVKISDIYNKKPIRSDRKRKEVGFRK